MTRYSLFAGICCTLAVFTQWAIAGEADPIKLMTKAHEARATWDDFPGFTADLVVSRDGERATGKLSVSETGEVSVQLSDSFSWAMRKLKSLVGHRLVDDERRYDVSFADDRSTPLGRLIKINDDALMGSRYRVQGDVIREVHRNMKDTRFTISVIDVTRNKEGKHLPTVYTVSFWDAKTGALKSTSVVRDSWQRVGKWDLPKSQLSVESSNEGTRHVNEIRLNNIRLLAAEGN